MSDLGIFQEVYDAEINFNLSTFFDGGFYLSLGDGTNGYIDSWDYGSMIEAGEGLKKMVIKHYPDSDFALKYRDNG
jgi:hypothetical protein